MSGKMMQLGGYQFSIDNAAYQRFFRSSEYRWAAIERVGKNDALQFTGLGADTISLQGVIYPHFRGGLGPVDQMRRSAEIGFPLPLIAGPGTVLGGWVRIRSVCRVSSIRIFGVGWGRWTRCGALPRSAFRRP
jgi:phage protein U